jgi:hypothetical protein
VVIKQPFKQHIEKHFKFKLLQLTKKLLDPNFKHPFKLKTIPTSLYLINEQIMTKLLFEAFTNTLL